MCTCIFKQKSQKAGTTREQETETTDGQKNRKKE